MATSIRLPESIGKLTKTSSTTVQLAPSRVNLAGKQYRNTSAVSLSTSTIGVGGMESAIAASTFYYVYAVANSGTLSLIASTSSVGPSGFSSSRKVGAFYTDASSVLFKSYYFGEINAPSYSAKISAAGVVTDQTPINWLASVTSSSPYTGTFNAAVFSLSPNCVFTQATDVGNYGNCYVRTISTTTITYSTVLTTSNTPEPIVLVAHKAGIDATQPDWSF